MGFLDFMSDVFGAGWSALASNAGTRQSYKNTVKLLGKTYDQQMKGMLESPAQVRKGLENAGYNPLLATNATGSFATGTGGPSSQTFDAGSNLTNAFNARTQRRLSEAQINNTNASTNNINADTENKKVQNGILLADKKIREYESDMKKFDKDTQAYTWAMNMKEAWARTKVHLETARLADFNAISYRIASNAQKLHSETSAKWTPYGIGAGLSAGIAGYALGKIPGLKYLNKKKVGF